MKNKTLLLKKEVLVVFFCVSFLTLCLSAIGAGGRYRAKMVLCQLNLKQMANGSLMYADDNEGKLLPNSSGGGAHDLWMGSLAGYVDKDEVRYCPATNKNPNEPPLGQWTPSKTIGSSKISWVWNFGTELEYGSYAFNGWFKSASNEPEYFSNLGEVQQPAVTPFFADSMWVDAWPQETDTCPADFDLSKGTLSYGGMMGRFLMNRHFDKTNIAFADGHVDSVELKQLWSLTWHKNWTPVENMTRIDGSPIYPE